MSTREQVVDWLNDAYAMEQALEETLRLHATDAKDHPDLAERLEQHAEETRAQAETVRSCIEKLGGKVSGTKSAFANVVGAIQGMVNKPMSDTMLRNGVADYAAEHFEIATYRALIEACENIGEPEIVEQLTRILHQEEAMARFLEEKLPVTVQNALAAA